jgi:hypothetical protein
MIPIRRQDHPDWVGDLREKQAILAYREGLKKFHKRSKKVQFLEEYFQKKGIEYHLYWAIHFWSYLYKRPYTMYADIYIPALGMIIDFYDKDFDVNIYNEYHWAMGHRKEKLKPMLINLSNKTREATLVQQLDVLTFNIK